MFVTILSYTCVYIVLLYRGHAVKKHASEGQKISTIQIYEKSPYLVLVYEEKSWHSLLNDLHASKRS